MAGVPRVVRVSEVQGVRQSEPGVPEAPEREEPMGDGLAKWLRAALVRAAKTAAQAALGAIGASATMGAVDWALVGSTALLAAIASVLTSLAGVPEVDGGASVAKVANQGR